MATDQNGCWWWHSIALADGVVTPGEKSTTVLEQEWRDMALPSLHGKTVLDIGAWDGWFSFAAERAGASRVVALDWFVWSLDFNNSAAYHAYVRRCKAAGSKPLSWGPDCPWWNDKTLPGKRGFDTARLSLCSRVEEVVADFTQLDPKLVGSFDVVFFLGVFYHLQEPLAALRRLRSVTKELAVIETAAIVVPEQENRSVLEFAADDEINHDPTNWWFPNERAMHDLLHTAGFNSVRTVAQSLKAPRAGVSDYRLTVHASP
jgi:tRNA (mo5U34)-methyltransferase